MGIVVRPYVHGQDEPAWVDISNRAWQEDEDFTPDTVEELKRWDNAPWVGVMRQFIAELDGVPVAKVRAETDKERPELKGFITGPDVVPEHRRKGIGTTLALQALASLRDVGMKTAEIGTFDTAAARGLIEKLGFRAARQFCRMRRTLTQVPAGVGEARDVEILRLDRTDESLALLNRVSNEAFKEHYNYVPGTVDDLKYWMKNSDERGARLFLTAARAEGEPVGFLMYGIDPKGNEYHKKKRGGLWSIGVLKQYRGRGIARRLMIDAMNHLRGEGMEEAELGVDETNVTNAIKVYESLGFTVARRRLTWLKDLT